MFRNNPISDTLATKSQPESLYPVKIKPGTTVERYVVKREIGAGGIGRVYLVQHIKLKTLHALKIVQHDNETTVARLL